MNFAKAKSLLDLIYTSFYLNTSYNHFRHKVADLEYKCWKSYYCNSTMPKQIFIQFVFSWCKDCSLIMQSFFRWWDICEANKSIIRIIHTGTYKVRISWFPYWSWNTKKCWNMKCVKISHLCFRFITQHPITLSVLPPVTLNWQKMINEGLNGWQTLSTLGYQTVPKCKPVHWRQYSLIIIWNYDID